MAGQFNIMLNKELEQGDCIYAFDTCTGLVSPVVCTFVPAPAPALSPALTAAALAMLSLIALIGVRRLNRGRATARRRKR
jgi:hypothetical protein